VSWWLAATFIDWILPVGQGLFDNLAVNHKARQVRQALGNPVLLAGQAADGPTHPALGGGVDRLLQVRSGVQAIEHIVGKVATVAAVQEGADRFEGLEGGVRNRRHRDGPGGFGVLAEGPK